MPVLCLAMLHGMCTPQWPTTLLPLQLTQMAHLLQAKGFRDVYNIVGGIDAYSKEVDPSVPVY